MRSKLRFSHMVPITAFVVACGAGAAADAAPEMTETAPEPTVVASSQLACVVMGDTEGRASPLQEVRFTYEGGEGLLCYGAPSARGREVMGGLVPYGQPWRAGANEPTTLHISAPMTLGGVALEAGSYSLYAIPGESEWEFFINTNYERWGIPIDANVRSTEVGSFTAAARSSEEMVETLVFEHMSDHLMLSWENTHIHLMIGS